MVSPSFLSCLLLLPLGTCFPLLDGEEPMDTTGGVGGEMSWAGLARGHGVHLPWGSSQWPSAPHPHVLLVVPKELQMSGRARAGAGLRPGRRDEDSAAAGPPLADGQKARSPLGTLARSPLGTLAEELSGYSRKKGGFSFRFGRR